MTIKHVYRFIGGVMADHNRVCLAPLHDDDGFIVFNPTSVQMEQYMAYRAEMKPGDREPDPPRGPEYRVAHSVAEAVESVDIPTERGIDTQATYYMIPASVLPGEEAAFFCDHIRVLYHERASLRHQLNQK